MYSRLYDFLNKYNCLYKKQFGFQNSYSTNHALITITETIREALDGDEYSCGQGCVQAILMSGRQHKKLNLRIEFSNSIFIKF